MNSAFSDLLTILLVLVQYSVGPPVEETDVDYMTIHSPTSNETRATGKGVPRYEYEDNFVNAKKSSSAPLTPFAFAIPVAGRRYEDIVQDPGEESSLPTSHFVSDPAYRHGNYLIIDPAIQDSGAQPPSLALQLKSSIVDGMTTISTSNRVGPTARALHQYEYEDELINAQNHSNNKSPARFGFGIEVAGHRYEDVLQDSGGQPSSSLPIYFVPDASGLDGDNLYIAAAMSTTGANVSGAQRGAVVDSHSFRMDDGWNISNYYTTARTQQGGAAGSWSAPIYNHD